MIEKNKTRDFWDDVATNTSLDEKAAVGMLTEGNEYNARLRNTAEQKHFVQAFPLNPDMNILEVGSGGGRWTFFLAEQVRSVVGIDFSENMTTLANRLAKSQQVTNVRFEHCELTEFLTEQRFDMVYFSGVLQYLTDDDVTAHIERARALLNEGGYIVSRDTIQVNQRVVGEGEYPVVYRTSAEYEALFQSAGYRLTYSELSFPDVRFSHFASKVYALPVVNFTMARGLHKALLRINRLLGDPRWLKKAHHKALLDTIGEKQHRFFKYESTPRRDTDC